MSEVPAFTVPLDGVDVGFRASTSGQLILMQKILRDARKKAPKIGEDLALSEMIVSLLDVIENNIIEEEHLDHMLSAMAAGKINVPEIMLIIRQGKPVDDEPDDDEDPVVKPRANKTRTKKN